MKVLAFIAFWGLAVAVEQTVKEYQSTEVAYEGYSKTKKLYLGMYPGKCEADGFYYKDEYSFMMCSNGNPFVQNCAPGSKNSGYERYATGVNYYIHDFCDVNMVDTGYNSAPVLPIKPAPSYVKPVPLPTKPVAPVYNTVEKVVVKTQYAPVVPKGHFVGKYPGQCGTDGFYYNDEYSFVMCSNGNAYVQRCAPGSRNSGLNRYHYGNTYYYNDFCDVNLVDYGYPGAYGNELYQPSYYPNPRFYHHGLY